MTDSYGDLPSSERSPIGVGVVGLGMAGHRHAQLAHADPASALIAAFDTDPSASASLVDVSPGVAVDSWREAVEHPAVNAVVVATPPSAERWEVYEAALAAGKALLIEKPFAIERAMADRLLEMAGTSGVVSVTSQAKFSWDICRLRTSLGDGVIGSPILISASSRVLRGGSSPQWIFDPERGGGVVMESLCHLVEFARWVSRDEFVEVDADWIEAKGPSGVFDHTVAVKGKLRSGTLVMLSCSFGGPPGPGVRQLAEVVCTEGSADIDLSRHPLEVHASGSRLGSIPQVHSRIELQEGAAGRQWRSFLQLVANGHPSIEGLEDAALTMDVVFAVRDSCVSRSRIPVDRRFR